MSKCNHNVSNQGLLFIQFSNLKTFVKRTGRARFVTHLGDGHICNTFKIETSFSRYQNVSVLGVASVFQTSGRRFANVLDFSGSSCWTRFQNVLGRNIFHTLSIRARFRCCISFQNVRKTFCKRTGRLRFVTLDTSEATPETGTY